MDNKNYLAIYQQIDQFIAAQAYDKRVSDSLMSGAIGDMMKCGGKRVRSVLCCMAHTFFSPLSEDAMNMAWAIELFHNFTLVHDDIMDEAPLRRSQPTLYHLHGTNTALLIGDVMLIEVYDIINQIGSPHKAHILSAFNKTAKDICIGQLYDLQQEKTSSSWTLEDYMQMIKLKTAVLIGRSLYLGALIGGASLALSEQFYDIGVDMGLIFQMQDDYLDLYGETTQVGKQKGGDIIQGKKNILYFKAMERLDAKDRERLADLMENYKGADKVECVQRLYEKVEVKTQIIQQQQDVLRRTEIAIARLPIPDTYKTDLIDTTTFLLSRMS